MSTTEISKGSTWLTSWTPEERTFWESEARGIAWRTLFTTTFCLILAFATWFMVSAIVVRLQGIGFKFNDSQLFWLTAMPGLAGGILRLVHTFLIPIFGTRHVIAISTLLLVIPCLGWGFAVQNPETPFWVLMVFAFLAGFGGGNFSSFMPSTSLFFPKRLQGTALGIQAGVGNFGVSVAQFVVPWIIGFALLGSALGAPQSYTHNGKTTEVWLQNAAFVWVPFILIGAVMAWVFLRSVPVRANFRQQMDIFKDKHTWLMTSLYIMTFGSFSGFAATFPMLIKTTYGKFENPPDPLTYAFLGAFVGALIRIVFGPISDKFGGARVTQLSGIGLVVFSLLVTRYTTPSSLEEFPYFIWMMLGIFLFAGVGNASTFKQIPMIFSPRQAGGVIGWTAAVAAFGPFMFSVLFSKVIEATGSPTAFFYGAAVFYLINIWINWWYYTRKGAEKPC